MRTSAFLSVPIIAMAVMTGVWADSARAPSERHAVLRAQAPLPIRWMPDWLLEPLEKAIADANDPRDRKPRR